MYNFLHDSFLEYYLNTSTIMKAEIVLVDQKGHPKNMDGVLLVPTYSEAMELLVCQSYY